MMIAGARFVCGLIVLSRKGLSTNFSVFTSCVKLFLIGRLEDLFQPKSTTNEVPSWIIGVVKLSLKLS